MSRAAYRSLLVGALLALALPGVVQAHGPAPEPSLSTLLTGWSRQPLPWLGLLVATVGYLSAVRRVNRGHPRSPVARSRVAAWLLGLAAIGVALVSPLDLYADDLFSVHMVQHLLLAMVAPPLLALGAPMTLALRAATPGVRRRVLLPVLHSRVVAVVSWPPVAWLVFTLVMWIAHFSPLFNAALENDFIHDIEHLLFLGSGILFWWPVVGRDPARWRLPPAVRGVYLLVQMPFNTAIGLVIYFATTVLYPHYATLGRTWGPDPLTDQQIAGIVMWGVGDLILVAAIVLAAAAWLRSEEHHSRIVEKRGAALDQPTPVQTP